MQTRWTLFFMLFLALPSCLAVFAGEEIQPMHPGSYGEVGPGMTSVSALQRSSSIDPAPRPNPASLHRNMVRLTLPSLGAKEESRARVVDVRGSDDWLRFSPEPAAISPTASSVKDALAPLSPLPPASPAPVEDEFSAIPGLITPETLAMDQYVFFQPEPRRADVLSAAGYFDPVGEGVAEGIVMPPPPAEGRPSPEVSEGGGFVVRFADLADDLIGPTRRLDESKKNGDHSGANVDFSAFALPPPLPGLSEPAQPERAAVLPAQATEAKPVTEPETKREANPAAIPEASPASPIIPLRTMPAASSPALRRR